MFEGFTPRTLEFMWELRFNNRREWFLEHKQNYQDDLLRPFKALAQDVYERLGDACERRGMISKVSRIYKDARRVRDGEPYRDHLWFCIEKPREDSAASPVFWFELQPESWSTGLGYYMAKPLTMAKLRARIDASPEKFEKLIAPLTAQDAFIVDGPEYARKKQAPTEKTALFYNRKSFSLIREQQNGEELFSGELAAEIAGGFEFLMPYYDYFAALDGDPDPGF